MRLSIRRLTSAALSTLVAAGLATTVGSATAAPPAAAVTGPDVSGHQHPSGSPISWGSTKAAGARFAFVKATEGADFVNPYFAADFSGAGSVDLVRGAYHYARPGASAGSATTQARHFVAVAGKLEGTRDLPPVLDIERSDGLAPAALIAWTRTYLGEVERLTGRRPIIYTYPAFWRSAMADTAAFSGYPLWIATYRAAPVLVGGWTSYLFWQYTDKARLAGISGPVDVSVFNGSTASLKRFARDTAAPATERGLSVSATLSKTSIRLGSSVTINGATSGRLAGETLYRQGYWSGSWHTWDTTRVRANGTYTFTIHPTNRAVNTYRVHAKATSRHSASSSRSVQLRVR